MATCKICGDDSDLPQGRRMCRPCYNESRLGYRKQYISENPVRGFWYIFKAYLNKGEPGHRAWRKAARWAAMHAFPDMGDCRCGKKATERHHRDIVGDILDIELLCHDCHNMEHE